jgi:hypothetical protein
MPQEVSTTTLKTQRLENFPPTTIHPFEGENDLWVCALTLKLAGPERNEGSLNQKKNNLLAIEFDLPEKETRKEPIRGLVLLRHGGVR